MVTQVPGDYLQRHHLTPALNLQEAYPIAPKILVYRSLVLSALLFFIDGVIRNHGDSPFSGLATTGSNAFVSRQKIAAEGLKRNFWRALSERNFWGTRVFRSLKVVTCASRHRLSPAAAPQRIAG